MSHMQSEGGRPRVSRYAAKQLIYRHNAMTYPVGFEREPQPTLVSRTVSPHRIAVEQSRGAPRISPHGKPRWQEAVIKLEPVDRRQGVVTVAGVDYPFPYHTMRECEFFSGDLPPGTKVGVRLKDVSGSTMVKSVKRWISF